MIFSRWGSFGRFIMLATGIGAASSMALCLIYAAIGGGKMTADDLRILALFIAVGAGLGLFMGVPAYWVVRLFVRWLPSQTVSVLFFFALGAASVVVPAMIIFIVSGGNLSDLASLFTASEFDDLMQLPLIATLGGVFTALCAPLVLRPVPDSLNRTDCPGPPVASIPGSGDPGLG